MALSMLNVINVWFYSIYILETSLEALQAMWPRYKSKKKINTKLLKAKEQAPGYS